MVTIDKPRDEWALPENVVYKDTGCDLFPACLTCPLPRCRYDVDGGARIMLNYTRNREIWRMRCEKEFTINEIMEYFQVSRRTVFRASGP